MATKDTHGKPNEQLFPKQIVIQLWLDLKGLSGRSYICTIPQTFLLFKKEHRLTRRSLTGKKIFS